LSVVLLLAGALTGCNGGSGDSGDGGPYDATALPGDSEPLICQQFTDAGLPCSPPSPVLCFAECEAGGCRCSETPEGPRWVCTTDLSCIPDCAPIDDGCSPVPTGDDGSGGDDGAAGDDGGGSDGSSDSGADAGAATDAGDAGGDSPSD
jgi:hypothetical protein